MMNFKVPDYALLMYYIKQRNEILPNFYNGMKRAYLIRAALMLFSGSFLIPSFGFKNKKYIITTTHHLKLFSKSDLQHAIIVGGWRELLAALKHRIGFINTTGLYWATMLYSFYSSASRTLYGKCLEDFVLKTRIMAPFSLLLIDSDGLPYKRSLCLAVKQVGISVVCLQHGIFHASMDGIDGSLADLNVALDERQLDLFIRSKVPPAQLTLLQTIMEQRSTDIQIQSYQDRRVILVGEGWKSHDIKKHNLYNKTLAELKKLLLEKGIHTYFRPHPAEKYAVWTYLNLFPFIYAPRAQKISPMDIYIGATSSLLVESAKIGAQSIQISDLLGIGISFEEYGVMRCNINRIPDLVAELLMSSPPNIESSKIDVVYKINLDKLCKVLFLESKSELAMSHV